MIVIIMEPEAMFTFEQMMAQEEVVWANHYGPLCSMFTRYKSLSHAFPLVFYLLGRYEIN